MAATQHIESTEIYYYIVEWGDTLEAIADHFGTPVADIVQRNKIYDRDLVVPGQVLALRLDFDARVSAASPDEALV